MKHKLLPLENLGKVSCLSLLLLALSIINPTITSVNALESDDNSENNEITDSVNYDDRIMTTAADSGVTISFTPSSGSASLTPVNSDGATAKINVSANIQIASTGGYSVRLSGENAALTGAKTGQTIAAASSATTLANLKTNTWGYTATEGTSVSDSATYSALPQGQGVKLGEGTGNATNVNRTFTLSFATKIGDDKPADTYSNKVTLSVVSSPLQVSLNDISTMQEMTSDHCAGTAVGTEKQLKDTRDGKYYWVAKLADGKCWMTQNLALDLSSAPSTSSTGTIKTLSSTDTDLNTKSSWTPTSGTYSTVVDGANGTILANDTGQRSWNLGSYYINTPNGTATCGFNKASLADCSPTYFTKFDKPITSLDEVKDDVNAHYLAGNYYQWCAATAGCTGKDASGNTVSEDKLTSGEALDSICPKGWKLPASNSTAVGSFGGLLAAYSIPTGNSGITSAHTEKLTSSPLYFVRGGGISQFYIRLNDAAQTGRCWSATVDSGTSSYNLYFADTSSINPSNSYTGSRQYGYSVRCIAR